MTGKLEMADEQEQNAVQAPTDEQVTAWANQGDTSVEPQGAQPPQPKEEAKAVEAPAPAPALDRATLEQMMKDMLNPINSELGQLRKLRSEFDRAKNQTPTNNTPQSWASMTPEQQQQTQELIEYALAKSKYGERIEQFDGFYQQQQLVQQGFQVENLAKEFAGEQFKDLDPIMARMVTELQTAAETDQRAARRLWEIQNTEAGIESLVNKAKQELGQQVHAKAEQAVTARQNAAKKAGVNVSQTSQSVAPRNEFSKLSLKEMRQQLIEQGML
jgi:hypothetical protein